MRFVTTEQMRRIEAAAVAEGLEYLRLMENAGSAAARVLREQFCLQRGTAVVILCGKGNNGGDGFVIARKLCEHGAKISVVLADGAPQTPDAAEMFSRLDTARIKVLSLREDPLSVTAALEQAELVVDSVYGIGFHGTLPGHIGNLFRRIPTRCRLVAIDVPSGLNADTGVASSDTPTAHTTITFTAAKIGFSLPSAAPYCGKIEVTQIGIDAALVERECALRRTIEAADIAARFAPRKADSHKGTYGNVLSVCGSYGMAGAAFFAAKAALRSGAGLVTAVLPDSIYPIVATMLPEAVFVPLSAENGTLSATARSVLREKGQRAQAIVAGCGLGINENTETLILDLITARTAPLVLDADGITILAQHIDILKTEHAPLILTPHPGEMARLCGKGIAEIQAAREETALQFAVEHGVTVVLKGHQTVVATPQGNVWINTTGNPGMATGGSGDVLAGIISGLLAQGFSAEDAALCGVYLHGLAGDRAAERLSQAGLLPSDLLEELPCLF